MSPGKTTRPATRSGVGGRTGVGGGARTGGREEREKGRRWRGAREGGVWG